jgi:hypothetical protein
MRQSSAKQSTPAKANSAHAESPGNVATQRIPPPKHGKAAALPTGFDFARIPVHQRTPIRIQPELTAGGGAGDAFEQETDRVDDTAPMQAVREALLQRRSTDRTTTGLPAVLSTAAGATSGSNAQREQNVTGMPIAVRAKLELALGADFSGVRVHYDSRLPAELGATAFAQGNNIHIAPGNWAPETARGQEILAHELTHVSQQRAGRVVPTAAMNGIKLNNEPALEIEADTAGRLAARSSTRPHLAATMRDGLGVRESWKGALPHLSNEAGAQRRIPSGFKSMSSQLNAGGVYQLLANATAAASPWWPITTKTRLVDLDGHDLDFKPNGKVDGPAWHDGAYAILENTAKSLTMKIQLGGNKAENDDLDVILSIKDGKATITGSIKGGKPGTYSSVVAGKGTESSLFHLDFVDKETAKKHSIKWRVDE